jgi:hypothetical protein
MNALDFIMAVETDPASLSTEEFVDGMAELVRNGTVYHLQGSWQRAAFSLIEQGYIARAGAVLHYPEFS